MTDGISFSLTGEMFENTFFYALEESLIWYIDVYYLRVLYKL